MDKEKNKTTASLEKFIIIQRGRQRFLCGSGVVRDGELIDGCRPLVDLSDNGLFEDFKDALIKDTPLPKDDLDGFHKIVGTVCRGSVREARKALGEALDVFNGCDNWRHQLD